MKMVQNAKSWSQNHSGDFVYIYTTFGSFRGYFFSKNPDFCDFGLPGTSKVLKSDRFYKGSATGAEKVIFVKFQPFKEFCSKS